MSYNHNIFEDYESQRDEYKSHRNKIKSRIANMSDEMINILNSYLGYNQENKNDISWSNLKKLEMNFMILLTEGVRFSKIYEDDNKMVFKTYMDKGSSFGEHKHSDCIEKVDVVSGELIDKTDNKIYKSGESIIYQANKLHHPISNEITFLLVTFINSENNMVKVD